LSPNRVPFSSASNSPCEEPEDDPDWAADDPDDPEWTRKNENFPKDPSLTQASCFFLKFLLCDLNQGAK